MSIFDSLASPGDKPSNRVNETLDAYTTIENMEESVQKLEKDMLEAARDLAFERAAKLRDRIQAIKARIVFEGNV